MKGQMRWLMLRMVLLLAFSAGAVDGRRLVWSVNGEEPFHYPKIDYGDLDQWPFGKPFYFLLDMQLGGKWVGDVDRSTLPVRMYIDWIRVYE